MLRSQEFNNTPNKATPSKTSKSAKKIISKNKNRLQNLSKRYTKHKNKIQSSFEAHLKKLNTLKRKSSQTNYLKTMNISSKKSIKKNKDITGRMSETAPRKLKPVSYFEHKSTFNTPNQKNYNVSKFQMSNILDNRDQKGAKKAEDKGKRKGKKKGKKKKKKNKGNIIPPGITIETISPKSDFISKFKYEKKTKFRSSYKTPIEQNIGFFSFNSIKIRGKGTNGINKSKSKNKTGDFLKNFPLKRKPLFEVEEKKESKSKEKNEWSRRGANSPIFKKMGRFLKSQNEDSFKLTMSKNKNKNKKESKSYLQITKSKQMIKKISIRQLGVKSSEKYSFREKEVKTISKKRRSKKVSNPRKSHSRSPQALKKNIINKISLPYKPVDFASFDLKRTKNISTSNRILEERKKGKKRESDTLNNKICKKQKVLFINEGKSRPSNNNSKESLDIDKVSKGERAKQNVIKRGKKQSISKSMRNQRKDR